MGTWLQLPVGCSKIEGARKTVKNSINLRLAYMKCFPFAGSKRKLYVQFGRRTEDGGQARLLRPEAEETG
jgi:hypothetical protein